MRNFTTEDFSGAGQYLIRADKEAGQYIRPSFMSTIMYKVGYITNLDEIGTGEQLTCITSMADGWTRYSYLVGNKDNKKIIYWQGDEMGDNKGKQKFVDWLNNPELSQEYRFATQEEVTRVVMYQSSRWRNY